LDINFIFPDASTTDIKSNTYDGNQIIRIAASFDMGWFTRGTGRTYDSLSGTAALIGYFTKKIIGYVTVRKRTNPKSRARNLRRMSSVKRNPYIQRLCADSMRLILLSESVLLFLRRLLFLPDSSCVLIAK